MIKCLSTRSCVSLVLFFITHLLAGLKAFGETPAPLPPSLSDRQLTLMAGYLYRNKTDPNLNDKPEYPSQLLKSNALNILLDYESGYWANTLRANIGWIGALSLEKDYVCSEVAFCSKGQDRQADGEPNIYAFADQDGLALYRTSLQMHQRIGAFNLTLIGLYDQ